MWLSVLYWVFVIDYVLAILAIGYKKNTAFWQWVVDVVKIVVILCVFYRVNP